jgi:hypothetical protein
MRDVPGGFKLLPLIEAALEKSWSVDPDAAVAAVLDGLSMVDRDKALTAAIQALCCLVDEVQLTGDDMLPGTPADW